MDCFFATYELPDGNALCKSAIVSFHIPDLGIRFKAPFDAVDRNHGDYASLLALLEFIDSNQKYFANHTFQIYGNNISVINQINRRETPPPVFTHLLEKALGYRQRYRFSLEWVPTDDNTAFEDLFN
jgi:Cu2+-containing amine oxidase